MNGAAIRIGCALFTVAGAAWAGSAGLLDLVASPREQSLGGATVALSGDAMLVWGTPSGYSPLGTPLLALSGRRGVGGDHQGQFLIARPVGEWGVALGAAYLNAGAIELHTTDGSARTVNSQTEWLGLVSLCRNLPASILGGVSLKIIKSSLLEEFSATGMAVDLGLRRRFGESVTLGVAVSGLGPSRVYSVESVQNPVVIRAGLSTEHAIDGPIGGSLLILAEGETRRDEGRRSVKAGIEYRVKRFVSFSAGGRLPLNSELPVFGVGIGLSYRRLRIEYAMHTVESGLQVPHLASVGITF